MLFLSRNGASSSRPNYNPSRTHFWIRAGAATGLVTLGFGVLQAQEAPESARQIVLDVRERLEWSDNPDLLTEGEDRITSRTSLGFGLTRRTRTDRFTFAFGGDLEITNDDTGGIENPFLGIGWLRDIERSRIGLSYDFSEFQLDSVRSIFNADTGSVDFVSVDSGTRRTSDVTFDGAFGVDGPFGGSYRLFQRQIDYFDTIDPGLRDADWRTFDGDLFVEAGPASTIGLVTALSDFDEQGTDALDTKSSRLAGFIDTDLTSRLSVRTELGWQQVEQTGRETTDERGVVFDVALAQELPRSTLLVDANSVLSSIGRRDTVSFGQDFDLPINDFRYSIGLSRLETEDINPLLNLYWRKELPRGEIDFDITQIATVGRDNEDLINTRITFGYTQELTTVSGLDMAFAVSDRDEQNPEGIDTRRYDFSVAYRHAMTQDWDFVGGYSAALLEEEGTEDRSSNTFFFGLEKQFVWN